MKYLWFFVSFCYLSLAIVYLAKPMYAARILVAGCKNASYDDQALPEEEEE